MSSDTGPDQTTLEELLPLGAPKPSPQQSLRDEAEDAKARADQLKAHTAGLRAFYQHRNNWSWFLIVCIGVTLVFQIGITIAVGLGGLDFSEYAWFLPLVVTENFAQVIGLALIVVNFLFNKESMGAWWKPPTDK